MAGQIHPAQKTKELPKHPNESHYENLPYFGGSGGSRFDGILVISVLEELTQTRLSKIVALP